ncbi:GNAT family N-acetyltransferase [Albibacterium sp.]|uniref:GNAT family N-acetyltransferase n=1 Tax=Albibacterium sp. TaxID=2952885 RepID=UPI002CAB80BE|nr:GNAT family N-acetyltransferase [Albibacterium sp.]HUH18762.1 GNAT family N-acetyltransferase [Albibacterium sp.]
MKIENSTLNDIETIFEFYHAATNYQKSKLVVPWPDFEREMVKTEILENRQWKIIIDGKIACVWATTFSDPQIWEERNEDPAVYIHRIAVNPDFRGQSLVAKIVDWAKQHAKDHNKKFIRMDTVGENIGLISHYSKCGFDFLGLLKLKNTDELPLHYHNATVSLFQIEIK